MLLLALLACATRGPARPLAEGTEPAPAAPAPAPAAAACPAGMAASSGWQGEYPGPVVEVTAAVAVPARAAVCDAEPGVICTLSPGLVHPWAQTAAEFQAEFQTLRVVDSYRAKVDVALSEGRTVPAGTVVEVPYYVGEGFCVVRFDGQETQESCPDPAPQLGQWEELPSPLGDLPDRQFFRVPCAEGWLAWVEVDDALLARPEIGEGEIVGYGEVGPSKP